MLAGVLLFGGSFDPIHHGHLIVCAWVGERLGVDRTVLIPSARPPHKSRSALAPADDRLAMCRLAVEGDPRFEVSDWELTQPGPNYTLHTVRHFREQLAESASLGRQTPLYWLIGMDSLRELPTWHRVDELASAANLVTARRPGAALADLSHLAGSLSSEQIETLRRHILDTPHIEISATDIRERVAARRSIQYLVPPAVERYVRERGLYEA
jgi:nicotinate-nucleotide adenylyltransferase